MICLLHFYSIKKKQNLKDEVTDELKIDQDDFIKTIENVIKIHKIQNGPIKKRYFSTIFN